MILTLVGGKMLTVISVLAAVVGMTMLILRFRPPQGDTKPVSEGTLQRIIRLECLKGDTRNSE